MAVTSITTKTSPGSHGFRHGSFEISEDGKVSIAFESNLHLNDGGDAWEVEQQTVAMLRDECNRLLLESGKCPAKPKAHFPAHARDAFEAQCSSIEAYFVALWAKTMKGVGRWPETDKGVSIMAGLCWHPLMAGIQGYHQYHTLKLANRMLESEFDRWGDISVRSGPGSVTVVHTYDLEDREYRFLTMEQHHVTLETSREGGGTPIMEMEWARTQGEMPSEESFKLDGIFDRFLSHVFTRAAKQPEFQDMEFKEKFKDGHES